MKKKDGGGSQQKKLHLRMEVMSTAIGFLLRLMDKSTGTHVKGVNL